ncbi:MAG: GAF domain-containing protein [Chloroflexi bacterium]|nr:GAF domain-containing protein [Chloroflexota bacterium]
MTINSSYPQEETLAKQRKNALQISLATFFITGLIAIFFSFFGAIEASRWAIDSANTLALIISMSSLFSVLLNHRGRFQLGIIVLLFGFSFALIMVALFTGGMDILLVGLVLVVFFGIASSTLSRKMANRAIQGSFFLATLFVINGYFEPFDRAYYSNNREITIATLLFTLFYGVLIYRQYSSYTLRTKLVVVFVFLSTVGISIAFLFANFDMQQALEENAQSRLLAKATASASKIDAYLNYREETVATTSTYLDLRAYLLLSPEQRLNSQIHRQTLNILYAVANRDSDALSYGLLDLEGVNIADSNSKKVGLSEADQDYFQLALNAKKTYISPVRYLSDDNKGVLFISSPINNDMGVITGILRAEFRASILQELLAEQEDIGGEGAFSILFDSNHIVLAHDYTSDLRGKIPFSADEDEIIRLRENLLLPPTLSDDQLSLDIKAVEDGLANLAITPYFSSEETSLGFALSGAITQLDAVPWLIVAAQPEQNFLAPIERQEQRFLFAAIAMILFGALTAIGVANVLVAPILQLQNTAQQFSEGDLKAKAIVNTNDEIGVLATTFNALTSQLRGTVETLEVRIEERTEDLAVRTSYLESAAEISHAVSSIMDPDALAAEVTELIKERFDLYYAGLFLVDENKEWAILQAGTGEAGQKMVENNHKIKIGEGMIGWSIENAESRIALDVGDDAVRFENPHLPETRSEGALPLRSRGRVLGALTVQSTEEAAFDESIITTFQTMTDQIAIAFDNAELFAKAEDALLSERRAYGQFSQQSWQALTENQSIPRFIVKEDGRASTVSNEEKTIDVAQVAKKGQPVQGDDLTVVMPIKNREYVLGGIKIRKKEGASPWSTEELSVIESISEQLSVALESARLFDQTQRKAQREAIISDISAKIGESRSVDAIINTTIKELGDALNSPAVSFHLQEHSLSSEKKDKDE